MSESKECHASNNDILANCLKILYSSPNKNHKKHLASSHGIAAAKVRNYMERKLLANQLKEVWEL